MAKYEYVSLCCGATVTTYEGNHSRNPEKGPADDIEVCDECGRETEPIDVICGNCHHFWAQGQNSPVGFCLGDAPKCIVDADEEFARKCDDFGIETEPRHDVIIEKEDLR